MGGQGLLFDRFRSFDHSDFTVHLGAQNPPDVDGIKFLIKMTRLQNIFFYDSS